MNIFYLDHSPRKAAEYHCDDHMKMILESAQLLSTAHRVLDGTPYTCLSKNNRRITRYKHPDETMDDNLYQVSHINHPCAKWCRTFNGYYYTLNLMHNLGNEFYSRRGKEHASITKLGDLLCNIPKNIMSVSMPVPQCMPDKYRDPDPVIAYRNYYIGEKSKFATWASGNVPKWYEEGVSNARTSKLA